jgi:2-C-methyl-D-erythritol 4-phosphate cytidylyltransferase/2-C-methyl-D-erythritol 2,4-cyclodiphosphate synthase
MRKQWRDLGGRRVADWTLMALRSACQAPIIMVLHPDDVEIPLPLPVTRVTGGASRSASVRAGLRAAAELGLRYVLIHDVARPCVAAQIVTPVIEALRSGADAAAPGLPVTDALWVAEGDQVSGVQDRSELLRAQTPQGFDLHKLIVAHDTYPGEPADDVEVARAAGMDITITKGHEDNIKITLPEDFDRALRVLRDRMDIRLGNGYDVHAFTDGDHVTLCGVSIPHDRGLLGHSDADVGMHAITDAIYGALAQGDIGRHFPPSDPQWKGAASEIFLRHAVELAGSMGFGISNIDCTLICEAPKIGPHAAAMIEALSQITGLDVTRISVKATTSEQLGFTGRKEGIAAQATALLVGK